MRGVIVPGEEAKEWVEEYVKVNPAGVDLAPRKIFRIGEGMAYVEGEKRGFLVNGRFVELKENLEEVEPRGEYWEMEEGRYYVLFPRIRVPEDCVAFMYPRSTFNRLGIIKSQTAVYDPGYEGEGSQLFVFLGPAKIHVKEAWVQIVYFRGERMGKYRGYWYDRPY